MGSRSRNTEGEAMKTEQEIEQYLNESLPEGAGGPSKWPGMSYEQGVDAALRWVLGYTDEKPMED
jgi:hypothetical protein